MAEESSAVGAGSFCDYQSPTPGELALAQELLIRCRQETQRVEETPDSAYAMQLVLHLPHEQPPARSELIAAAAQACLAVCFDARAAQPTTSWAVGLEDWYRRRIRKVTRRARGAKWERAHTSPGVTVTRPSGAAARAYIPGLVTAVPAAVARLQIRGTDLPHDTPADWQGQVPLIAVDAGLDMSMGKAAAQAAHAGMLHAAEMPLAQLSQWARQGFALQAREVDSERFRALVSLPGATPVVDAGFTEVPPGSMTAVCVPGETHSVVGEDPAYTK